MHSKITKNLALTAVLGLAHGQTCPRSSESAMNLLFSVIMPTKYTDYTVKSWLSENESLTFKEGERKLQQWQMGIRAKNTIQRIVNGYDTPADEAPYYVRILSCQNGASCGTCGASWISSTTILTAAHCHASNGTDIYYYKNPSDNSLQPSYTSPNVDSWIFHPCWDENGSLFQENYDVLVLTVTDAEPPMPIRLATPVNFAGLSSSYPSGNNDFISYGFGRTIGDGSDPTPSVLQRTYGIEYFSCSLIVYANGINRDDILCFNIENEHAICQGDSGGPRTKDSILYGLHSGFLSNTGGADCATNSNLNAESPYSPTNIMMTGSFSFDVSVAHYRDWIIENSDYSTDGVEFYGDQFTTTMEPASSTEMLTESTMYSTEYSTESTEYPTESTEYSTESTEYPTESTEYSTESTEYSTESTEYSTEPTEHSTESTETMSTEHMSTENMSTESEMPPGPVTTPVFDGPTIPGDFEAGENPNPQGINPFTNISPTDPIQEIIKELISGIFDAYGITGITFIPDLFSSRRKRQTGQDALNAIADYGCWCSKPFTGESFQGQPLDDVDRLCKKWSQCQRCIGLESCTGAIGDPFTVAFIPASDSYTCTAGSNCGLESCECMAELGIELARSLVNTNFQLDANNNNVLEDRCIKNGGAGFTDACCGASPTWTPYSTQSHQCVAGDITTL